MIIKQFVQGTLFFKVCLCLAIWKNTIPLIAMIKIVFIKTLASCEIPIAIPRLVPNLAILWAIDKYHKPVAGGGFFVLISNHKIDMQWFFTQYHKLPPVFSKLLWPVSLIISA